MILRKAPVASFSWWSREAPRGRNEAGMCGRKPGKMSPEVWVVEGMEDPRYPQSADAVGIAASSGVISGCMASMDVLFLEIVDLIFSCKQASVTVLQD